MSDKTEASAPTAKPRLASRIVYLVFWLVLVVVLFFTLQILGFQPQGDTGAYLEYQASQHTPATITWPVTGSPDPDPGTPEPLTSVVVDIWFLNEPMAFPSETVFASRLERGQMSDGRPAYFIEFDEAGLNQYLNYWFGKWASEHAQLRDTRVKLLPGGLIIYGEINLGVRWQQVGVTFHLDDSGRQLAFTGVDVDGEFLTSPPVGPIAQGIEALEAEGNRALREVRFIDPEGELAIQQVVLLEDTAQVLVY
ncbi:MAG: hypothetical protein JXB30_16480 [Anaerolineae bacterium]|nr:hypothetical protein [Anaerolineae bacterium]